MNLRIELFTLPLFLLAQFVKFDSTSRSIGQVVVLACTAGLALLSVYIETRIVNLAKKNGEETLYIDPNRLKRPTPEQLQKVLVPVSRKVFEIEQLRHLQLNLVITFVSVVVVPSWLQIDHPILMQGVLTPIAFLRDTLCLVYVYGKKMKNPWNAASSDEAKAENLARERTHEVQKAKQELLQKNLPAEEQPTLPLLEEDQDPDAALWEVARRKVHQVMTLGNDKARNLKTVENAINLLVDSDKVDAQTEAGRYSALMGIARLGNLPGLMPLVTRLIENKAQLGLVDSDGWNVLHWAGFYGASDLVELLLCDASSRSLISSKALDGSTPLEIAKDQATSNGSAGLRTVELLEAAQ